MFRLRNLLLENDAKPLNWLLVACYSLLVFFQQRATRNQQPATSNEQPAKVMVGKPEIDFKKEVHW